MLTVPLYKDRVKSSFDFPNNTVYVDAVRMVVEIGLALALDAEKLPNKGGGFYALVIEMGAIPLKSLCMTGCMFGSRTTRINDCGGLKSKLWIISIFSSRRKCQYFTD